MSRLPWLVLQAIAMLTAVSVLAVASAVTIALRVVSYPFEWAAEMAWRSTRYLRTFPNR